MSEKYCPYCMTKESGDICPKCGLSARSYSGASHHLPAGTVLAGRYAVGRILGEGGFGITYMGIDTKLNLKVAIKEYYPSGWANRCSTGSLTVSHSKSQDANYKKGKDRFIREAKTMAMLDKQTEIATVRDFFESNQTAYIVMEYVNGITLKARVQSRGPVPAAELFSLIRPIMDALSAMHKAGLIHRDISPDNLMIENGRLRLIDFGCARESLAGNATMTVMLKHGFSPVEQYQQKGQGAWSDIYALCATLYYCLTGKVPPQAVDRIVDDKLIPPRRLGVNITAAQEAALLKGLAVKAVDRYQSITQLSEALLSYMPSSAPYQKPKADSSSPADGTPPVSVTPPASTQPAQPGPGLNSIYTPPAQPGPGPNSIYTPPVQPGPGSDFIYTPPMQPSPWDNPGYVQGYAPEYPHNFEPPAAVTGRENMVIISDFNKEDRKNIISVIRRNDKFRNLSENRIDTMLTNVKAGRPWKIIFFNAEPAGQLADELYRSGAEVKLKRSYFYEFYIVFGLIFALIFFICILLSLS